MRTPTAIVTQPLDLMKTISREQLSDSRDMGFVHFLKKTNNCKLKIIIAKSVIDKYFFFCEHFLTPFKTLPVTQLRSRERGKLHFRDSNFTNVRGGMPPDPPRSSCLRHSTFVPTARTVHVRQLNHCIRYFQMLPKTLGHEFCIALKCPQKAHCNHRKRNIHSVLSKSSQSTFSSALNLRCSYLHRIWTWVT